jgi:hypothetical protein
MSTSDSFNNVVDNNISAANTFSDSFTVSDDFFLLAVSGTFVGTLTLQLRPLVRDVAHNWVDEQTYTGPVVAESRVLKGTWQVQIGFKTGAYTSGTAHTTLAA